MDYIIAKCELSDITDENESEQIFRFPLATDKIANHSKDKHKIGINTKYGE